MKLPNVIRKNKSLAIVVLVTFLAALFLIFECFIVHSKIQEGMTAIENADQEIQRINNRKMPNPVRASSLIINKNSHELRTKIDELYRTFGNPYRKNLIAFLNDLNTKDGDVEFSFTESKIIELFREAWDEFYSNNSRSESEQVDKRVLVDERNKIYDLFVTKLTGTPVNKSFDNEQQKKDWEARARNVYNKAFDRFHANLKSSTLEANYISANDAKHILMQSFGLPRTMSSQQCKAFIDDIQLRLERDLSIIPGIQFTVNNEGKKVPATRNQIHAKVLEFSYNHNNTLPPPGNVENILNHYTIIEDLFYRMRKAGVQTLVTLGSPFSAKPSGDPSGDVIRYTDSEQDMDLSFKKYVYEITIKSTVDQVRSFVNELHKAYHDYRVYEIEEMSFHRDPSFNEVKAANDALNKLKQKEEEQRKKDGETGSADDNNRNDSVPAYNVKKKYTSYEKSLIYSDDSYGKTVIGAAKGRSLVIAYIKVNYIVYTGNIIEKK
ncbi:MAG: hypothetical protein IKB16_02285 [Lentisphaeria bacterium]|nr:hypothetical protein [Lentisphaeria bacterium]